MVPESKLIVNLTRGSVVCEQGIIADHLLRRMRGLLGRRALADGEGMLLRPAPSIHTHFMRFPIDAVFLDYQLEVVKIVSPMVPWRTAGASGAKAVLELSAGEAARRGIEVGDRLGVLESGADSVAALAQASVAAQGHRDGPGQQQSANGHPKVLLVGADRRFRSVTAALLTRRGFTVTVGGRPSGVAELAAREHAEVVVIDVGSSLTVAAREAARLERLDPPVGVVLVGDEHQEAFSSMRVVAKWDSFDALFDAVEQSRHHREERSSSVEPR